MVLFAIFIVFSLLFQLSCNRPGNESEAVKSITYQKHIDKEAAYVKPDEEVWADPDSGLMWQVWPEMYDWESAIEYCKSTDYYGYNDWRLPTISELRTLVRGCPATQTGGDCGVTDSCNDWDECWSLECMDCDLEEGPATGGCYWPDQIKGDELVEFTPCYYSYWSSTEDTFYSYYSGPSAWVIFFEDATISGWEITSKMRARCVR